MKKFDGIISTKTDISSVYKVITTELPVTKYQPNEVDIEPIKQSLVLIGGDGRGYDYGERIGIGLRLNSKIYKYNFYKL